MRCSVAAGHSHVEMKEKHRTMQNALARTVALETSSSRRRIGAARVAWRAGRSRCRTGRDEADRSVRSEQVGATVWSRGPLTGCCKRPWAHAAPGRGSTNRGHSQAPSRDWADVRPDVSRAHVSTRGGDGCHACGLGWRAAGEANVQGGVQTDAREAGGQTAEERHAARTHALRRRTQQRAGKK